MRVNKSSKARWKAQETKERHVVSLVGKPEQNGTLGMFTRI